MRLIIYVEIHLERNLEFKSPSEDFLLLKNNIKNEELIELDNFSEVEYLELIFKSFVSANELVLVLNQFDDQASLGAIAKLLRKLKAYKSILATYTVNCKLPPFYKQVSFHNMGELLSQWSKEPI